MFKLSTFAYRVAFLLLAGLIVSGCASSNKKNVRIPARTDSPRDWYRNSFSDEDSQRKAQYRDRILLQDRASNYVVGSDDVLSIYIYEWAVQEEEEDFKLRVSKTGNIAMPGIGIISVGGLTAEQIQAKLKQELQNRQLIQSPRIAVEVTEYRTRKVAVVGEFKNPGLFALTLNAVHVSELIALAGGPSLDASPYLLITQTKEDGEKYTREVDLEQLFAERKTDGDILVADGDILYLPTQPKVAVYGNVSRPGVIPFDKDLTLQQAIALAGGTSRLTDKSNLRVLRNSNTSTFPVNLNRVEGGKRDDPLLADGDVIIAPLDEQKNFLLKTYQMIRGFVAVGYGVGLN